jgi:hypothetical protein
VTISMTDGSTALLAIPMAEYKATGRVSKRGAESWNENSGRICAGSWGVRS